MKIYFSDTSGFAKRYLPEIGSVWVQSWIEPKAGNLTIISAIGTVEFIALLGRRQREGSVSQKEFVKLRNDFLVHVRREYRVISVDHQVLAYARQLTSKHPLRTLDALQLASSIVAAKIIKTMPVFISADKKLLAIAALEGFSMDDPNAHP
ncbi:MAG: type II toxin-antitoxin system VapC family toxin [Chitinophagaceae bacterium]|nr:type II toxin-antitoxin system VapC family toxin [Anaerolineae bacterium]